MSIMLFRRYVGSCARMVCSQSILDQTKTFAAMTVDVADTLSTADVEKIMSTVEGRVKEAPPEVSQGRAAAANVIPITI